MQAWLETMATTFKLSSNLDWLRPRQGLALPTFPPSSSEAHRYFFTEMCNWTLAAAHNGGKVNMDAFAQDWNSMADGKTCMYVTPDILSMYAHTWNKTANIKTSRDLISIQLSTISKSAPVFAAVDLPFPPDTTGNANPEQPSAGVRSLTVEDLKIDTICGAAHEEDMPELPLREASNERSVLTPSGAPSTSSKRRQYGDIKNPQTGKRQRKTLPGNQQRAPLKCRRCHSEDCPGHSDRARCPEVCTIPCRKCG